MKIKIIFILMVLHLVQPTQQAFLCGLGAKNEEQESKTARKMMQVNERGGSGSRFISRAVKTENPVPRSFFAPKLNGNACHAGYTWLRFETKASGSWEMAYESDSVPIPQCNLSQRRPSLRVQPQNEGRLVGNTLFKNSYYKRNTLAPTTLGWFPWRAG